MADRAQLAPPKVTAKPFTAGDLCARLRRKYPAEAYAMLYEVRNGTGFERGPRSADVLMMSLWPSRGLELTGFEVKVSRSDWKRELADPGKAEAIQRYCDRWFILAAPGVVPREELPPTWGLMVPYRDGLGVDVEAPKLQPDPIDRLFFASVLRSAASVNLDHPMVANEIKRRVDDQLHSERFRMQDNASRLEKLQARIAEFETMSGVRIDGWNLGNVTAAVKIITEGGLPAAKRQLEHLRDQVGLIHESLNKALKSGEPA